MLEVSLRTIVPIFLLIALGYFARRSGIFREGSEKVLSSYVYYFALPALFLVDLAATRFDPATWRFVAATVLPILLAAALIWLLSSILRRSREERALFLTSTVFGSSAFFGVPFIVFAFALPLAERLAVLSAAFTAAAGLMLVVINLEVWKFGDLKGGRFGLFLKKLGTNPLIISILIGLLLAFLRAELPPFLQNFLQLLGKTTATIAIVMLGVFIYGREQIDLKEGFSLSLFRIFFLPVIAWGVTIWLGLTPLERAIVVLMHSMPAALSLVIFAERYDFRPAAVSSLIIFSSLAAAIYLNFWLFLLAVN